MLAALAERGRALERRARLPGGRARGARGRPGPQPDAHPREPARPRGAARRRISTRCRSRATQTSRPRRARYARDARVARRHAARARPRAPRPRARRPHGLARAGRSGPRRDGPRGRADGPLPGTSPDDADLSRCSTARAASCGSSPGAEKKPMLARLRAGDRSIPAGPGRERRRLSSLTDRAAAGVSGGLEDSRHPRLAGDLEAVFLPGLGMLGASLRHRGVELLRRVDDLEAAAAKGSTAGIPLLHPWANRLDGLRLPRRGTRRCVLDPASPLLHLDGARAAHPRRAWSRLAWEVTAASTRTAAPRRLDWNRGPSCWRSSRFRTARVCVALLARTLSRSRRRSRPASEGPVPVAFGFHPYLGLPGPPRAAVAARAAADAAPRARRPRHPDRREDAPFGARRRPARRPGLRRRFRTRGEARDALDLRRRRLRICASSCSRATVRPGLRPEGQDFVALEPMTAPTNALASGRGLRARRAGRASRAAFRVRVEPDGRPVVASAGP